MRLYRKHPITSIDLKPILHKKGKKWIVVGLLSLLLGLSLAGLNYSANASVVKPQPKINNIRTTKVAKVNPNVKINKPQVIHKTQTVQPKSKEMLAKPVSHYTKGTFNLNQYAINQGKQADSWNTDITNEVNDATKTFNNGGTNISDYFNYFTGKFNFDCGNYTSGNESYKILHNYEEDASNYVKYHNSGDNVSDLTDKSTIDNDYNFVKSNYNTITSDFNHLKSIVEATQNKNKVDTDTVTYYLKGNPNDIIAQKQWTGKHSNIDQGLMTFFRNVRNHQWNGLPNNYIPITNAKNNLDDASREADFTGYFTGMHAYIPVVPVFKTDTINFLDNRSHNVLKHVQKSGASGNINVANVLNSELNGYHLANGQPSQLNYDGKTHNIVVVAPNGQVTFNYKDGSKTISSFSANDEIGNGLNFNLMQQVMNNMPKGYYLSSINQNNVNNYTKNNQNVDINVAKIPQAQTKVQTKTQIEYINHNVPQYIPYYVPKYKNVIKYQIKYVPKYVPSKPVTKVVVRYRNGKNKTVYVPVYINGLNALNRVKVGQTVKINGFNLKRLQAPRYNYFYITKACLAHLHLTNSKFSHYLRPNHQITIRANKVWQLNGKHGHYYRYQFNYGGKTYFITANQHYLKPAYYRSNELKHNQLIKVIHPCAEYKNRYYNHRTEIRGLKAGQTLRVKKVIYINKKNTKMTRFLLSNGHYVTSNKNYVKVIK